jgi:hypothetical protein
MIEHRSNKECYQPRTSPRKGARIMTMTMVMVGGDLDRDHKSLARWRDGRRLEVLLPISIYWRRTRTKFFCFESLYGTMEPAACDLCLPRGD